MSCEIISPSIWTTPQNRQPIATRSDAVMIMGCGLCMKPDTLIQCSYCKAVRYCCSEHQVEHRGTHNAACKWVFYREHLMDIEEKKLRKAPENPFESRVGAFWHLYWTRDYMKARYGLVEALMRIHTRLSVELQLDHRLEMFKLSRRDYLAVRFTIPSLMMRLGQDQECYDFVQLQAWNPEGLVEDEENKDMPWLSAANKDSFESVEFMCHASPPLECAVHVTLLKIRLLFDLMALRDSEAPAISGNVPRELLDIIQGYALHTNVVLKNQRILQLGNQSGLITTLCEQIRILWRVVRDADVDFWPILLAHGEYLRVGWYRYLRRDMTQAEITLQDSYRGWIETPGAIEVIKNLENDGKIKGETLYPCCCPAPWNAIDEHE